jgi:uncharacterized protein (TIGR00255 family)
MTGYTEKKFNSSSLSLKIIIKTLNHRFFDWMFRGNQFKEMENRLRAICQNKIHRGRVEVQMDMNFLDQTRWEIRINHDLLETLFNSLDKMVKKRQEGIYFSVDNLFSIPHMIELDRKDLSETEIKFIEDSFFETLQELIEIRQREGLELKKEIQRYLKDIRNSLGQVEKMAGTQPLQLKEKMVVRLRELAKDFPLSEDRIIEEAAYLAQKYDLTEEITRLNCHLDYADELLSSKTREPAGKKLDFLAQELYREINTINSKSQDVNVIKEGLVIKNCIESIRQQVQNIE